MALYNKYRPKRLSQLCGQEHVKKILTSQLEKDELVHAYLFTGPAGTGKTTVARILAAMVNCKSGPSVNPPSDDEHVAQIVSGRNQCLDVIEIDAATNTGIDDVRGLREKLEYAPALMRKKVVIIDECHRLSPAAWEGLLKILEEPPSYALFVLCTTEPGKVTETVKTRCMIFDFRSLPAKDIRFYLQKIAESEKIDLEEGALSLLANSSKGSLRLGISRLEKIKHLDGKITSSMVSQVLGTPSGQVARKFLRAVVEKKFGDGLAASSSALSSGVSVGDFITSLAELSHDILVCKGVGLEQLGYDADSAAEVMELRNLIGKAFGGNSRGFRSLLRRWIHKLNDHANMVVFNLQPQFQADFTFVELLSIFVDVQRDFPPTSADTSL